MRWCWTDEPTANVLRLSSTAQGPLALSRLLPSAFGRGQAASILIFALSVLVAIDTDVLILNVPDVVGVRSGTGPRMMLNLRVFALLLMLVSAAGGFASSLGAGPPHEPPSSGEVRRDGARPADTRCGLSHGHVGPPRPDPTEQRRRSPSTSRRGFGWTLARAHQPRGVRRVVVQTRMSASTRSTTNGGWYNFGFLLGLVVTLSGGARRGHAPGWRAGVRHVPGAAKRPHRYASMARGH